MLNTLTVKHFQSLHDVTLDLAPFTVIVGPSSSGKSALTRALKTLAANQRGTKFIEHRQKSCLITAENDTHRISLKRSTGTTGNEYRVESLDGQERPSDGRYTKLSGTTPEEVSKALRLAPTVDSWHAGQFDGPYLLSDTGGEVARTLGALTNVGVIFEAARESNRRRQAAAATLKTREADLASIKNRAKDFSTLKQRKAAVTRAEAALEEFLQAERALADLDSEWESLKAGAAALKETRAALQGHAASLDAALAALNEAEALEEVWDAYTQARSDHQAAEEAAAKADQDLEAAEAEYQQALHDMGQCPTCGQDVP